MKAFIATYKGYVYLALVIALVGLFGASNWWSYNHGIEHAEGEAAKAQVVAIDEALATYKEQAQLDQEAAVAAETKRQQARIAAERRRTQLEQDISRNPRPACDLNPTSFGLLVDSINEANGATSPSSSSLSNGEMPPNSYPFGRHGFHYPTLDKWSARILR